MKKLFFATIMLTFLQVCRASDIIVSGPMTVNNTWNLMGSTLRFQQGGYINGTGTITNGSVDANFYQNIFGSGLTIQLTPARQYFSASWFGTSTANGYDNYPNLQRAINVCIKQTIPIPLFIPPGTYSYSQPLLIANVLTYNAMTDPPTPLTFAPFSFHMFGGSQFWSTGNITTLAYTGAGNTYALGIQAGRGVEINNLKILGKYKPPTTNDANTYYFTTTANYTDAGGVCFDGYSGVVIDPYSSGATGGCTGIKMHDLFVSNFAADFSVSPNNTINSEMLIFENIQLADSKWGILSGFSGSKGNVVRGLYSWGKMHTLISIGKTNRGEAGFWTFDGGNIAGKCIRLCDIASKGWYPIKIKDFYCEAIGSVGTILSSGANGGADVNVEPPIYVQGCNFDFVVTSTQQVLLNTQSARVKFESSTFRFYTGSYPTNNITVNYVGAAPPTFENCTFSGTNTTGALFLMN